MGHARSDLPVFGAGSTLRSPKRRSVAVTRPVVMFRVKQHPKLGGQETLNVISAHVPVYSERLHGGHDRHADQDPRTASGCTKIPAPPMLDASRSLPASECPVPAERAAAQPEQQERGEQNVGMRTATTPAIRATPIAVSAQAQVSVGSRCAHSTVAAELSSSAEAAVAGVRCARSLSLGCAWTRAASGGSEDWSA